MHRYKCAHIQLVWSYKATLRQRQSFSASGPGQEPHYDKAEDGCQKPRNVSSSRRLFTEEIHQRLAEKTSHPLVSGFLCMIHCSCLWLHVHVSFACLWCNYPCGHTQTCVSVHVCQADQMLCCSLQGALISCVFTVTDGQQSNARPTAGQARMNGTAFKRQHPQGSRLTHLLHHYIQTYTWVTCFYQCKIDININILRLNSL